MKYYLPHVFYDVQPLNYEQRVNVMNEAVANCLRYTVNELDCSKSFARRTVIMTFEEVTKKFSDSCHFSIIYRRGYRDYEGEVGFATLGEGVNYFLWIYMDADKFNSLIEKYNLKVK